MAEIPKIVIPLSPLDQHLFQRRCQRLKAVSLPIASPSVSISVSVDPSIGTRITVYVAAAPGAKAEAEGWRVRVVG